MPSRRAARVTSRTLLRALAVAFQARQAPLLRPAAVAVHDDAHVARQRAGADFHLGLERAWALGGGLH